MLMAIFLFYYSEMQFFMSRMNLEIRSMMITFLRKFNRYTHITTFFMKKKSKSLICIITIDC